MNRRTFLNYTLAFGTYGLVHPYFASAHVNGIKQPISTFAQQLEPIGRILETKDYYVWGASPVYDQEGNIHIFYSRWPAKYGMGGWIHQSEIAHAVAHQSKGPFEYVSTILKPRGKNYWDGTTCHNPHIKYINGKYCLFYMGNSNGKTNTKRIGLTMSSSPYGPWEHADMPLIEASTKKGAWDNHCTTNPSLLQHPNGQFWLYYKSWNTEEYDNYTDPKIRGNRKYGIAMADQIEGPYHKYQGNPVLDYSGLGNNIQAEDGFVWYQNGKFKMLLRDMGFYNHQYGLLIESEDGIHWSRPSIAYYETEHYFHQPPKPPHLSKYGRFERPQILFNNGIPAWLFVTSQGGKYETSSPFLFQINKS